MIRHQLRRIKHYATAWSSASKRAQQVVDADYYASCYGFALENTGLTASEHFWKHGVELGYKPREDFDPCVFAIQKNASSVVEALHDAAPVELLKPCRIEDILPRLPVIPQNAYCRFDNVDNPLELQKQPEELKKSRAAASQYAQEKILHFEKEGFPFRLYVPAEEKILAFLRQEEGGALLKLPHGFWDTAQYVTFISGYLEGVAACFHPQQRRALSQRWAAILSPANGALTEGFYDDVLQYIEGKEWDNATIGGYHLGLALKGYPTWDERLLHIPGDYPDYVRQRANSLSVYFPPDTLFLDGTLFKRWAITGTLSRIMNMLRERPVLLVASDVFVPLPSRLGFAQAEHYVIPRAKTHRIRYRVLEELKARITRQHQQTGHWPVVIAQAGGSLTFWLLQKLCAEFPKIKCMDFGQTLNIWMLDSCDIQAWLQVYAEEVITNNGLEAYYTRIGHPEAITRLREMRW